MSSCDSVGVSFWDFSGNQPALQMSQKVQSRPDEDFSGNQIECGIIETLETIILETLKMEICWRYRSIYLLLTLAGLLLLCKYLTWRIGESTIYPQFISNILVLFADFENYLWMWDQEEIIVGYTTSRFFWLYHWIVGEGPSQNSAACRYKRGIFWWLWMPTLQSFRGVSRRKNRDFLMSLSFSSCL